MKSDPREARAIGLVAGGRLLRLGEPAGVLHRRLARRAAEPDDCVGPRLPATAQHAPLGLHAATRRHLPRARPAGLDQRLRGPAGLDQRLRALAGLDQRLRGLARRDQRLLGRVARDPLLRRAV